MFRAEILHRLGGYDTGLGDDTDLSMNLLKQRWKLDFSLDAVVWTIVPQTRKHLWSQRMRWTRNIIKIRISKHRDQFLLGRYGFANALIALNTFACSSCALGIADRHPRGSVRQGSAGRADAPCRQLLDISDEYSGQNADRQRLVQHTTGGAFLVVVFISLLQLVVADSKHICRDLRICSYRRKASVCPGPCLGEDPMVVKLAVKMWRSPRGSAARLNCVAGALAAVAMPGIAAHPTQFGGGSPCWLQPSGIETLLRNTELSEIGLLPLQPQLGATTLNNTFTPPPPFPSAVGPWAAAGRRAPSWRRRDLFIL